MSTVLSFGVLAPTVSATTNENPEEDQMKIEILSAEKVVTKDDLLKKFRDVFPERFDFLSDSEFHMSGSHRYPDEDIIRHELNFHKQVGGKDVHGSIAFVGEDLNIEHFYYSPANEAEALFPAKVSEEEAKELALTFLDEKLGESNFKVEEDRNYYYSNQTLTEPIRYSFSFVRLKNDVPVSGQRIHVEVLGNGDIVQFSRHSDGKKSSSYDEVTNVLSEEEVLDKLRENLSVNLRYQIWSDPQNGDPQVQLVYQPMNDVQGIDAVTGKWLTPDGFTKELPENKDVTTITDEALEPRKADFTVEDAEATAKELLAIDSENMTLRIQGIEERKNHLGKEVISVHYMYEYRNGGRGAGLEFDRDTGAILQYRDIQRDVLREQGDDADEEEISKEAALDQAVEYLKEYTPSYLDDYAMPVNGVQYDEERDTYHFAFPRVVDGVLVNGDHISVQLSGAGELLELNVRNHSIEEWPSKEEVLSEEEALETIKSELSIDLRYVQDRQSEEDHYNLVYTPTINDNPSSFLNANTGEWDSQFDDETDNGKISHPWAEKELNYLLRANILDVEDATDFDADQSITKGEAIEVIMKSLTRFYQQHYPEGEENLRQSFENIDSDHPLYQVIERSVTMGILDEEKDTFDADEPMTREQLAVWYVRALGLEKAAEFSSIYQLDFKDLDKVEEENTGYVALADSLGLLTDNHGRFYPDQEVTYAQLAVSNIRLAHEAYEEDMRMRY